MRATAIPRGFYVYAYLRARESSDGNWLPQTPYYIGKGKGRRCISTQARRGAPRPTDINNVVVLSEGHTEAEAFALEMLLIKHFGRVDLGTGCLRNLTIGGDGPCGYRRTEEMRRKDSNNKRGPNNPHYGKKPWNTGKKLPYIPHPKAKGRDVWNRGLKMSPESCRLNSLRQIGTRKKLGKKERNSTSPYHGVSRRKIGLWGVCIRINNKTHYIGCSNSELVAASMWDRYVIEHGLDWPLNFPNQQAPTCIQLKLNLETDFVDLKCMSTRRATAPRSLTTRKCSDQFQQHLFLS